MHSLQHPRPILGLLAACVVLLVAANASPGPPDPSGKSVNPKLAKSLAKHLKPWHPFQQEWAQQSSLIFLATYKEQSGPCITFPDGSRATPLNNHFVDWEVLKGRVAVDNIFFEMPPDSTTDSRFPHGLIEGQRYLLFLAPSDETAKRLLDPKDRWGIPISEVHGEVLAIVDLSQTEQEARLYEIEGTRTATYQGVEFTPIKWQQLRKADPVDLDLQKQLQAVIQNRILNDARTLADVRSYLGAPDECDRTADSLDYTYYLNLYDQHKVIHDQIVTRLELEAAPDTRLTRARIIHRWLTVTRGESGTSITSDNMDPDTLQKHGLQNVAKEYGE